jgi:two-component system alkaline phosphatase synthesis response regulator PhoP
MNTMANQKLASILLVEDEVNLHESLKMNLELQGYEVTSAYDGAAAMKAVHNEYFDLIIMDVMLPEIDGFTVTQNIRLRNTEVPILILSARDTSSDRVTGLKKGADDYLTKPFDLEELLLRVQKLIDKNKKLKEKSTIGDSYSFGGNRVDFKAQQAVTAKGEKIELSKKEAMLLKLLIENENEVVPREKILQSVWGYNVYPTTRTIDNFILSFRKYFEEDSRNPRYFHSVRGVGYKYTGPSTLLPVGEDY